MSSALQFAHRTRQKHAQQRPGCALAPAASNKGRSNCSNTERSTVLVLEVPEEDEEHNLPTVLVVGDAAAAA